MVFDHLLIIYLYSLLKYFLLNSEVLHQYLIHMPNENMLIVVHVYLLNMDQQLNNVKEWL